MPWWITCKRNLRFLSTLSLRRATWPRWGTGCGTMQDFYPRSPCGERPQPPSLLIVELTNFYPRSPCGERHEMFIPIPRIIHFYPRSPCGERPHDHPHGRGHEHFYPRSPCGERPGVPGAAVQLILISIHALLAESDTRGIRDRDQLTISYIIIIFYHIFNSNINQLTISIHALLAESDAPAWRASSRHTDFYPRSPCGERQCARGPLRARAPISIHALLAESDAPKPHLRVPFLISIHALLAESDDARKHRTRGAV